MKTFWDARQYEHQPSSGIIVTVDAFCVNKCMSSITVLTLAAPNVTLSQDLCDRQLYKLEMTTINISWQRGQLHTFSQMVWTMAPHYVGGQSLIGLNCERQRRRNDFVTGTEYIFSSWWNEWAMNNSVTAGFLWLYQPPTFYLIAISLMMGNISAGFLLELAQTLEEFWKPLLWQPMAKRRRGTSTWFKVSYRDGSVVRVRWWWARSALTR